MADRRLRTKSFGILYKNTRNTEVRSPVPARLRYVAKVSLCDISSRIIPQPYTNLNGGRVEENNIPYPNNPGYSTHPHAHTASYHDYLEPRTSPSLLQARRA